jgi:hypothetical protein
MSPTTYTVFGGDRLLFTGDRDGMLARVKKATDRAEEETILIFEDETGRQVDFDLRGTLDEVKARYAPEERTGPGRPKLGVISREVSLLPRHWEWLERQPVGLSGALRRVVEHAMKTEPKAERARVARDALGKVMWAVAGNLPDFEEASRALHAGDEKAFKKLIKDWPKDLKKHFTSRWA